MGYYLEGGGVELIAVGAVERVVNWGEWGSFWLRGLTLLMR